VKFPASEIKCRSEVQHRLPAGLQPCLELLQLLSVPLKIEEQSVQLVRDPAHLAFPATVDFEISADVLQPAKNVLEVQVTGAGWFTWDSLECISGRIEQRSGE